MSKYVSFLSDVRSQKYVNQKQTGKEENSTVCILRHAVGIKYAKTM